LATEAGRGCDRGQRRPRRRGHSNPTQLTSQAPQPAEESNPLEAISAISRSVAGNLDGVIKRCGDFVTKEPTPKSSRTLQRMLYEASFGDPVFLKARQVAEVAANISSGRAAADFLDDEQASSFRAIADVTRKVQEELSRLQGDTWASNVWQTVNSRPRAQDGDTPPSQRLPRMYTSECEEAGDLKAAYPADAGSSRPTSSVVGGDASTAVAAGATLGSTVLAGVAEARLEPPRTAGSSVCYASEFTDAASSTAGAADIAPRKSLAAEAEDSGMKSVPTVTLGGRTTQTLDFARLQAAFKRFKVPDSGDIHKADLYELLRFLGHVMVDEQGIEPLLQEVTPYEYLDFDEFQSFMERYIPYERQQFHVVFERFDTDKSGEICVTELKQLLSELNFMPMKGMLQEALSSVDLDSSGSLGFEEFVTFLKTYRHAEGFSTDEVEQLLGSFNHFASETPGKTDTLDVGSLPDALISVFGLHVKEIVEEMAERLASGQGLKTSNVEPSRAGKAFEFLYFSEFLIFARKVREAVYEKLRLEYPAWAPGGRGEAQGCKAKKQATFDAIDLDNSGGISESELRLALRKLGYTPLKQNVREVIFEVVEAWEEGRELDFNEFFAFMLIVRQREGFSKESVEEMRKVFNRFDEDDSGEVDSLELAELFRHLGHKVVLDEIHVFVSEVDANNSGQLDFREFLKLMRLYRENELKRYANVFNAHKERGIIGGSKDEAGRSGRLPREEVMPALKELGLPPTRALETLAPAAMPVEGLCFDAFVGILDACRSEMVQVSRKNASFSYERVQHFRDLFSRFDKDGSGDIDTTELASILRMFRWEPKTPQEQLDLVKKINTARARAAEAGVDDVGDDGSGNINFWVFVQLARLLETEREKAEEDRVNALVVELNFSQEEVDQFRQIFCERKRQPVESDPSAPTKADPEEPNGLSREAVRKLMRSLVTTIPPADKAKLDAKLNDLMVADQLDFPCFLRFMRWLLDVDFAGMSSRLASRASAANTRGGAGGE